ncbi:hypothetical protein FN846DRAFT_173573 [Sphaerosporella brunnea]|uniref:Uncharacterized protein n=1 Tax=Sphaerosporella brunnea TaxID=1250544 RepID=A0A5J5EQG5_9PEZI|nr:hypothetical protein FN846DRAFT_173573 [Sphaerosporella brunnea]
MRLSLHLVYCCWLAVKSLSISGCWVLVISSPPLFIISSFLRSYLSNASRSSFPVVIPSRLRHRSSLAYTSSLVDRLYVLLRSSTRNRGYCVASTSSLSLDTMLPSTLAFHGSQYPVASTSSFFDRPYVSIIRSPQRPRYCIPLRPFTRSLLSQPRYSFACAPCLLARLNVLLHRSLLNGPRDFHGVAHYSLVFLPLRSR